MRSKHNKKMYFTVKFSRIVVKNILNLIKKCCLFIKNYEFAILCLIIFSSMAIYCIKISSYSVVVLKKEEEPDVSCYNLEEENALELIENLKFAPTFNSIFFIETSCRGRLTSRQACSVEAAARAHGSQTIYVLFSAPVTEAMIQSKIFSRLRLFYNIRFARVYFKKFANDTPLEDMIANKHFYESRWWVRYASEIFRYLILYKYGGIYLDTDILVVKSLMPLGYNWIGRQDEETVNDAAMAISPDVLGQNMIEGFINELKVSYMYNLFGLFGPEVITKVLQKICGSSNVSSWSSESCQGFNVFPEEYFYPIYHTDIHLYFNASSLPVVYERIYAHHLWDEVSYNMKIEKGSSYMKLAEKYCPSIFEMFDEDFGT